MRAIQMLWLLDGYNVLHAMGILSGRRAGPHGLEKARRALLGRLASGLGSRAGKAVVVFDAAGAPPGVTDVQFHHGVRVQFAKQKQQADDLIEELIHRSASRNLTVVSNDQRLVRAAKQRQCQTQTCEEFIAWLDKQRPVRGERPEEPSEKRHGLFKGRPDPLIDELAHLDDDPALGTDLPFTDFRDDDLE
jgi:predicted RNA-binding protein with PIN domain